MAKRNSSVKMPVDAIIALGILFLLCTGDARAARILGMFPFSSRSHQNIFSAVTKELALRGHHVTVVTPQPLGEQISGNYTQIDVSKGVAPHYSTYSQTNVIKPINVLGELLNLTTHVCDDVLSLPEMRTLAHPNVSGLQFDLMLTSCLFSECYYPYAHVYDTPVVMICTGAFLPNTDGLVGNLAPPSFVPNLFLPFTDRMSFLERTVNFVSVLLYRLYVNFLLYPRFEEISRAHFGELPPLSEELRRTSLILTSTNVVYHYPRPLTPNIVEIGGVHLNPPAPLPKDLQNFMDEAKDGVIYFSLGSTLNNVNIPLKKREAIIGAFSELKQKILMKWEADGPIPGQPSNVRTEKWFPQSDLLAHSNVKVFITHGGLLSFQEATARGVPIIGIPFFGDQEQNMKSVVHKGVGLKLPFEELTKESLLRAIGNVLADERYRNNMKQLSAQAMDQPEHPLQRAIFWIEYVIRHKGAKHLQPASVDLTWYQLCSLDVILVLSAVPISLLVGLYCTVIKCCCPRQKDVGNSVGDAKEKHKKQ